MKQTILLTIWGLALMACSQQPCEETNIQETRTGMNRAKFEPKDGQVLLFVGQELEAIGGLDDYSDGYLDHYPRPAGFTAYTNLSPGDSSFGFVNQGLDGIWTTDNWGDHESNMTLQMADKDYDNMALAIGLSMVNHEAKVAAGAHDDLIIGLGEYLKSLAPRPVFLRIGYEFDGHAWNHYDKDSYLTAYRRIKDMMDSLKVENVAYVWQSVGWVSTPELLEEWYPGDEYVDWCAFSFFSRWREQEMIEFARREDKPVFIAESTPAISDHMVKFDGTTQETILSNPEQAKKAWEHWFVPFFQMIEQNPDVVKAVSYINCFWLSHDMWKVNPSFAKIDARLHTSEFIDQKWRKEISQDRYLHSSETLYEELK